MIWTLDHPDHGRSHLIYADPRRFGFIDLYADLAASPYLQGLGPEPLGNEFSAAQLAAAFAGKKTPVKAALLDQRVVAGLGNIYVAEALHRAHILPTVLAGSLVTKTGRPKKALEDLAFAVREVLTAAIEVGGSTIRDFRSVEGALSDPNVQGCCPAHRAIGSLDLLLSEMPEGALRARPGA
jgi:formamidopyrimidine-DNA glycosylase